LPPAQAVRRFIIQADKRKETRIAIVLNGLPTSILHNFFALTMESDKALLRKYLPETAVEAVYGAIVEKNVQLRISRSRSSKLGDYRPAMNGKPHRISLNHDLNPYEFLITFVHELAHLFAFEQYGRRHQPHGQEWKQYFQLLMQPYLKADIFPADVENELKLHLYDSNAANGSDLNLKRVLQNYDKKKTSVGTVVENLNEKSYFKTRDGRVFQKLELRRKRIKCICMNDNRLYLFSPLALVEPLAGFEPNQFLHLLKKMG
jgi:SprT protein